MIFRKKNNFYFSIIISKELIILSLVIIKRHLKPFLSYLPCIVCREYFSIIFNVKKCALYLIKYGKFKDTLLFFYLVGYSAGTNAIKHLFIVTELSNKLECLSPMKFDSLV